MEDTIEVEAEEVQPSTEVAPVLATVQVTPAEAKAQNEQINAVISEVLVEGKDGDYWKIPGTGAPTLLQPGAETLQRFFGLGRKLGDPVHGIVEIDGKNYYSCQIKCSVTNASDRVLSESLGYCDDTEAKRGGGPGSKWRGNRHTIIQIATKRAYVSAIKNATGTSNHFTADMEDSQEPAAAKSGVNDRMTSDQEKMVLAGLYQQKKPGGCSLDEAVEWIASYKEKADSRNWVAVQVLALLQRPDAAPVNGPAGDGSRLNDLSRLGPEPELPVDPPIPGQTTIEEPEGSQEDFPF